MLCWAAHLKGAPKQLYFHAAVVAGHKLYSFGGWYGNANSRDQIAVHVFDTVALRWAKLTTTRRGERPPEVPSMRYGHTAALMEDFIYVWGGYPYCKEMYLYVVGVDDPQWFRPCASGTVPEGREGHSACALRKVMYIHGGWNQLTGYSNDIYKMDTTAGLHHWSSINTRGTPPPASYCHSATIIGTKMFVFGGVGHQSNYNGVSVFDTETNCWLSTPSAQPLPRRRWCHSAFAYDRELYVFGGCNSNQSFNDLWKLNPETLSWRKVEPNGKGPRRMCRMCCCVVGDRVLLFGGYIGNSSPTDALYILDFTPSLKTLCHAALYN